MSDTIENIETEDFEAYPRSVLEMGEASHAMFVHFRMGLCSLTKGRKDSVELFRDEPVLMEQMAQSISEAADALCAAAELMVVAHQRLVIVAEDVKRLRAN